MFTIPARPNAITEPTRSESNQYLAKRLFLATKKESVKDLWITAGELKQTKPIVHAAIIAELREMARDFLDTKKEDLSVYANFAKDKQLRTFYQEGEDTEMEPPEIDFSYEWFCAQDDVLLSILHREVEVIACSGKLLGLAYDAIAILKEETVLH